ncbi:hypothetical protein [Alteribacillus iranensis]|uniref:Uncharacterized protein n=1 Tax=Alteribacillus iranensis TaxID=930128 RepID=A0A1I2F229_9BACI|nr:hypothetical protein [Alteribacillus iranensis]SFE98560.1 hypothetical protein SAMN05192532_1088 [Alteribacillus iranensis]
MHREEVRKRVFQCTERELKEWRKHVLYCLDYFQRARNTFEIEECEYILSVMDVRAAYYRDKETNEE